MKAIIAYDDLLSRPDTVFSAPNGQVGTFGLDSRNWLTDSLGEVSAIPLGDGYFATPLVYRFYFPRPQTVSLVAMLNAFTSPAASFSPLDVWQVQIRLSDAALTPLITSPTTNLPDWSEAMPARDVIYVPATPVAGCSFVDFRFLSGLPNGRLAFVGRVFAASGIVLPDLAEPKWSVKMVDQLSARPGVAGGVRQSVNAPRRQISVRLSGLTAAQAYGESSFAADSVPGIQDLQLVAGASKSVLFVLRADGTVANLRDLSAFGVLQAPPTIRRQTAADALFSADLQISEAPR